MVGEVRYARNGEVHIAYTVAGEGPMDLVYSNGIWSNLDVMWDEPRWARHLDRLASFSRLIVFDLRGVGLSDPGPLSPSLEVQMDDLRAVMDAAGSASAFLFGTAHGGAMSMLFAATYPQRTKGLVLYAALAKAVRGPDHPYRRSAEQQQAFLDRSVATVGTGQDLDVHGPSGLADPGFVRWWARFERLAATPASYRELIGIFGDLDIRAVLPAIQAPTLVLHRSGDRVVPVQAARHLAAAIPHARLVELPGEDHIPFLGDADAIVDEIAEFVTGTRPAPELDRVLSTVLFTDIVDSAMQQARQGDRAWREVVLAHHATVREALARWRGVENDTAGDGFYATFDGPARAVRCALEVRHRVRRLGIEVRAGVHTGECDLLEGKCAGLAVSIGARIASAAGPSEVLVSQTVKDLAAGSGITFADRGTHSLKGVPASWHLYAVHA